LSFTFHSRPRASLAAAASVAAATFIIGAAPAQAAPSANARLAAAARSAPQRHVVAIVQFEAGVSERRAMAVARRHSARVTGRLPLINGLALRLPARQAQQLAHAQGVENVTLNDRVKPQGVSGANLATTYPKTVAADKLWNGQGPNYTGKGVGVAVIDTGVAGDLVDFRGENNGASRVVANVVTNPLAKSAGDTYGHGTHVAGIIAGNGSNRPAGDPLAGAYIGIAPEADIVAVKVSDDTGNATLLDVINGLQFVVDRKSEFNIRVVNLSLSSDTPQSYKTDPLDAAVESAWLKGIVVVAAAGNRGTAADAAHYAPGNDPYAITVGALDEQGTKDQRDDTLAPYSSTGTTQDGFAKPEILAPGARIVAPLAAGSAFATLCPACIIGTGYIRASGTSMAAPVVAGAAVLLLQAHPDWTPDLVKAALMKTGRPMASVTGAELVVEKAVNPGPLTPANRGVTPNTLVDATTGEIDYTRSSWSRSSWSSADAGLSAGWARSSWSCTCAGTAAAVDPTRSSWSRSSWSSRLEP
jgi:serine protease AprX